MAKKFLSILLTLVLVLGLLPAAGAAAVSTSPTFSDMPDNWATEALESAVANGLLVGDDGKIMPDSPLTRAQMATIIARAFGATEEGDISVYADVKSTDWFAVSMAKAYKMGVMQGYAGKMDPNSNITREQAFAVLARALKLEISSSINKTFEDEGEISDWAKGEVYALVNAGYIQGSNGRLNPQANISRAEFAQMMHNLIKQYIKAEGEYTQVADGNIMVNVPNVTLKNVTITGDLIVGDGVGDGDLILDNVTIKGRLLARGGGVHSIVIVGGGVEGKVVVAKVDGKIRVSVEGGANVEVIVIDDGKDDVIIEGTVGTVEITAPQIPIVVQNANIGNIQVATQGAANVTVAGNASVTNVVVGSGASGTTLNVAGRVGTVETSAANTAVSGTGAVTTVTTKAGANNTAVTTPSTQINNEGASGVTAGGGTTVPANGSTTNNSQGDAVVTPPPAGGGGGGGGGSSAVAVSAISVSPKTLTLTAGGATGTITATVSPANATNKNVTWTSSNEAVATVVNGVVTPVSAGTATITATTVDGGKTASTTVIIGDLLVEEGGSIQAAIDDATAGDVIIVGDGDYTENLTINKAITLKSLNGSESTKIAGTITIVPLDDEKLQDVTVEGFTVTAPAGYKVYPVIHMNNLENVNILNNSVVADDTAYGAIGTSDGPAKVTGKISGNKVTGMIIVGTDGKLEVSNNDVTLTPTSSEGICFYPVGSTAVITVTGNTVGAVAEGNVQIKVNEKPDSVNGKVSEVDMLATITADNKGATAKLGWFTLEESTVAVIGAMQYGNLQEAINAAANGSTINVIMDCTLIGATANNKDLTFVGNSSKPKIEFPQGKDQPNYQTYNGCEFTFENLTLQCEPDKNYQGIQPDKVIAKNCVINGKFWGYAKDLEFTGCVFNQNSSYNIWTYGSNVTFDNCEFNSAGRSVLIYNEGATLAVPAEIIFKNCTFSASSSVAMKAAIDIDTRFGSFNVKIENCSASGFSEVTESGGETIIPGFIHLKATNKGTLTVTVDGMQVLADGLTYDADSDTYEISNANGLQYLAKAINTDGTYSGATVKLTQDIKLEGIEWTPIYANGYTGPGNNATLTIDGNGHTISDLSKPLIGKVWSAIKVNIKNLTISGSTIVVEEEDLEGNVGVGAFIGYTDALDMSLENCHLTESTVKGGHWTGGLVGYLTGSDTDMGKMDVVNCSVIDSTIEGKGSVGSFLGHATGSVRANISVDGATVTGNTVTSTGVSNEKAGSLMGTVGAGTVNVSNLNESNNTVKSNETIIIDRIYGRLAGGSLVID